MICVDLPILSIYVSVTTMQYHASQDPLRNISSKTIDIKLLYSQVKEDAYPKRYGIKQDMALGHDMEDFLLITKLLYTPKTIYHIIQMIQPNLLSPMVPSNTVSQPMIMFFVYHLLVLLLQNQLFQLYLTQLIKYQFLLNLYVLPDVYEDITILLILVLCIV